MTVIEDHNIHETTKNKPDSSVHRWIIFAIVMWLTPGFLLGGLSLLASFNDDISSAANRAEALFWLGTGAAPLTLVVLWIVKRS